MSEQSSVDKTASSNNRSAFTTYLIGFVSCIVLTLGVFTIVGKNLLSGQSLVVAIMVLAIIQLFVQLKCFLHLSTKPKARWNLATFIFTVVILLVLVIGSLWIMYSLNGHMMHH